LAKGATSENAISTRSGDFFFLILLDRAYQWSQIGLFILGNSSEVLQQYYSDLAFK
jgi:hypothetical protein